MAPEAQMIRWPTRIGRSLYFLSAIVPHLGSGLATLHRASVLRSKTRQRDFGTHQNDRSIGATTFEAACARGWLPHMRERRRRVAEPLSGFDFTGARPFGF